MRSFLVIAVAACAGTTTLPPASPKPPDAAAIKKMSADVLLAYDRADVATVESMLAREFIQFEGGEPTTRDKALDGLAKRKAGTPMFASRTWEHEKVIVHADHVLFVGKATETQGGNDKKGGYKYFGWYTLQWVPEGGAWKVRYWTWQRASEHGQRDAWNDIYKNAVGFNPKPNQLLVDSVKSLKPGTALDLTMGQGRNALYLASQGWRVTGVDISDEGMRIAREEAAKRKLEIEMIEANIDTWDFGNNRWDLVAMIYAGNRWWDKIKPSVKKGGIVVVEWFAHDVAAGQDDGVKPGELAKIFDGWEILRDEMLETEPDWATDKAKMQRFVARKK